MSAYPDHWGEVPLALINTFTSKTVDPASLPHQKFELYSVPRFPSRKPETAFGGAIGSTKQAVAPNDVLVCKINPRINRVWQAGAASDLPQIASSEWIVVRTPEFDARFLQRYFSGPEFRDLLCQDLTGVGGSLTRAQPKRVATLPIPVPPLDLWPRPSGASWCRKTRTMSPRQLCWHVSAKAAAHLSPHPPGAGLASKRPERPRSPPQPQSHQRPAS